MGTKGEQTREHILATAESIILQRGYSGTSIEEIISEVGITKGGFFYHFDGKNDLAKNLILRYLDKDVKFFTDLAERAQSLTEDPLQQLFAFPEANGRSDGGPARCTSGLSRSFLYL
jgi:TetR/AcrR family transcriptional repressor of nem operon